MSLLGRKIRLLRQRKGWGQDEVAKQLDISIPAYSKIETGITDINLSRLQQIASLFDMSVIELLNLNELAQGNTSGTALTEVNKKLMDREAEIIDLQKKIIDLFEQLKLVNK
jgi:transcriptional regulator with XRE-family HTH domain